MASGDVPNSVKEARERFDLYSDASLASRLQDLEFGEHFNANRQERRLVGSDTKVSRVEQMSEMARQNALRREELNRVAETDEEIARRMQEQFDREEEVKRFLAQKQAEDDERMARELQQQEQGRIGGYGTSDPSYTPPSANAASSSSSSSSSSSTQPNHIYSAQNNLNEHYADRASTSLIDLGALDALTTIPRPSAFPSPTNSDPFLSPTENRLAAYAPLDSVPLLPPPPEFVVRREQERAMDELARLQPRLALSGVDLAAATDSSPQYAAAAASHYAAVTSPEYATAAAAARTPPPQYAAAAATTSATSSPSVASTNPFLVDLMGEGEERSENRGGAEGFYSEFGLPPPSSLARGGGSLI